MKRFIHLFPGDHVKRAGILFACSALIALAALGLFNPFSVSAARPSGQASGKLRSGSVGITQGQTARLSVSNTTNKDIAVKMILFDEKGSPLFECDEIIEAGETYWMDVNGDEVIDSDKLSTRIQVRGEVKVNTIIGPEISGKLHPVLQVFDNATGQTTLVVSSQGAAW